MGELGEHAVEGGAGVVVRVGAANDIRCCADALWPPRISLACAIWCGVALRRRSRITGQSGD
ncbi:MAG: hypothetical protein ACXVXB_01425, partial [Nocardioidaceae bacterium]